MKKAVNKHNGYYLACKNEVGSANSYFTNNVEECHKKLMHVSVAK